MSIKPVYKCVHGRNLPLIPSPTLGVTYLLKENTVYTSATIP